jgi:hypothetical protein
MKGDGPTDKTPLSQSSSRSINLVKLSHFDTPTPTWSRPEKDRRPVPKNELPNDAVEKRGMDRRTMIKAAGIAGVAAWTAPVIIDSMASPAAAASCANGSKCDSLSAGAITYTSTGATQGGTSYTPVNGANTFTPCTGVATVRVQAWGGGGAGGTSAGNGGGGGGGGEYRANAALPVTACTTTYAIVIGAGGVPGGANGQSSTFNGTSVVAKGGTNASGATGGAGGSGGTGTTNQNGATGATATNQGATGGDAGNVGAGLGGTGGVGGTGGNPGTIGSQFGGGGGGGGKTSGEIGGPGAAGGVIVG